MSNQNLDGQIFYQEDTSTISQTEYENYTYEYGDTHPYQFKDQFSTNKQVIYERKLAVWKDLTTLPKTRTKCVKKCRIGPLVTCCGWKTEAKWYYNTATLIVSTKTETDIRKAIEECIKETAIATAIAAIISGGAAAATVAETMFTNCLVTKLGENLVSVRIHIKGKWGAWS